MSVSDGTGIVFSASFDPLAEDRSRRPARPSSGALGVRVAENPVMAVSLGERRPGNRCAPQRLPRQLGDNRVGILEGVVRVEIGVGETVVADLSHLGGIGVVSVIYGFSFFVFISLLQIKIIFFLPIADCGLQPGSLCLPVLGWNQILGRFPAGA